MPLSRLDQAAEVRTIRYRLVEGSITIEQAISALLARFSRPGTEGAVYGLDNSIGSGARSLAPIIGAVVMSLWGIRSTFIVSGVALALTAVFALSVLPRAKD